MAQPNPTTTTPLSPGDRLDKYEVREQIGAGGMAVVYKGYDALLDRFVAIKQINPDALDESHEGLTERFRREARIQKRSDLHHKHLVTFVDFLEEHRGLFLVQEFVDGLSLEQVLTTKPQPMDQRQALGIIGATAVALQHLHSKGVIHRDLKPSNILLPKGGGLKITDFGLAATVSEQDSLAVGTVRYMAPELFKGEKVDGRVDIYALGMVAYEMLLGRAAFNEAFKIVLRDQRNQALRWMKWHTNLRVRATPLTLLNKDISETLSDLVARMMEKDQALRISSADELLGAIRRHFTPGAMPDKRIVDEAAQQPVAPATAGDATARLATRSRLPWIAAALIAVNVAAGAGLWGWYEQRQSRQREQRRQEARTALTDAFALYEQGQFADAAARYEQIAGRWQGDAEFDPPARAAGLMAQAQLALQEERYIDAINALDAADALDVIRDRNRIIELKEQAQRDDAFAKIVAEIEGLIDQGRLSEARLALQQQIARGHPDTKKAKLDDLLRRVRQAFLEADQKQVLARAQERVAAGDRLTAIALLTEAVARMPGGELERTLAKLRADAEYDQAVATAAAAEARNDLAAAVEALRRAQSLREGDERVQAQWEQKIKDLRTELALERARTALSNGDVPAAEVALREVLLLTPDQPEALGMVKQLGNANEKASLVRAGDEAVARREYDTAIDAYNRALTLGNDPAVGGKLTAARAQFHLQRGRDQMAQLKLDAAAQEFAEVQRLAPEEPALEGLLKELGARTEATALVQEGDGLRRQSRFGDARRAYDRAKRVYGDAGLPTDEVQQRLAAVEYESLLYQARQAVDNQNWPVAASLLKILRNMPIGNTDEVRELSALVDTKVPATPSD